MVKKKEIEGKWVVIDSENNTFNYSNFVDALKHPGSRASIMTTEFYNTCYKVILA